jgi:hypothetical protein
MASPKNLYYEKRAEILVKNLKSRHFDAVYFATKEEALQQALERIPKGATVWWGGAKSAAEIGLLDAVRKGEYIAIDRDTAPTKADFDANTRKAISADMFISGANALALTGEMVNIDGLGNRVAAVIYGAKEVLVIAGMNKVCDTLDDALRRARTIAAPMNEQRFLGDTPCAKTGVCADCKSEACICNHIVITRHGRPTGRIKFILVGEELGM